MNDLVSRSSLIEDFRKCHISFNGTPMEESDMMISYRSLARVINRQPTVEAVPLRNVYRLIAGHSDYHGDNILSALTCVVEGKEVKPIKPLETKPVVHGKWEQLCDKYFSTKIPTISRCSVCGKKYNLANLGYNFCPECGADMRGEKNG